MDLRWFSEGEIGAIKLEHPLVPIYEFVGDTRTGERVVVD
jgi:hypothetical protein